MTDETQLQDLYVRAHVRARTDGRVCKHTTATPNDGRGGNAGLRVNNDCISLCRDSEPFNYLKTISVGGYGSYPKKEQDVVRQVLPRIQRPEHRVNGLTSCRHPIIQ
jgi:hypothetical protein